MKLIPWPIEEITGLIRAGVPFAFSRWGDGEWSSVMGLNPDGANCDGHLYFAEMRDQLADVLKSRPDYTLGIQPFAVREFGELIDAWLAERGLGDLVWSNADVFHRAQIRDELGPLIDAMRSRTVIVVGPDHLRAFGETFSDHRFVRVPPTTAFLELDRIVDEVLALTDRDSRALISLSLGPPAEIALDRLVRARPSCAVIDFGSLFDPLVGVKSRFYMRGLERCAL